MKKYYVWNDRIQVAVWAASPIQAVCEALKFYKFKHSSEVIAKGWATWDRFYIDERGFRNTIELVEYSTDHYGYTQSREIQQGAWMRILTPTALNWFDASRTTEENTARDEYFGDSNNEFNI